MVNSVSKPVVGNSSLFKPGSAKTEFRPVNPYADPSVIAPTDFSNGSRPQLSKDALGQWYNRAVKSTHPKYYYGPEGLTQKDLLTAQTRADNNGELEDLDSVLSSRLLKGFSGFDKDKNGALNLDEIAQARAAVTIEQGNTMTQTQAQVSSLFQTYSGQVADGKGISRQDLDKLTSAGFNNGYQTPVASLLKRNFNAFDTNSDGNISYNEMITAKFQDGFNYGKNLFKISG